MAADYKALKNGGFMQQVQKDTFSMRLKVVGGNLTAGQLTAIAQISEKFGGGYVHLTSRQGVEIPFIKLADVDAVRTELEAGSLSTGMCGPQVRTVTACQGSAVCPSGCIDTYSLARKLSDRYLGRALPHKFKIGVTGCRNNCLKAEENDLGVKGGCTVSWSPEACTLCGLCLKACRDGALTMADGRLLRDEGKCVDCGRCAKACPFGAWKSEPGYLVSFGGTFGNRIAQGRRLLPILRDEETLFRVADAALDFFDRNARPRERLRFTVERAGWDAFQAELEAAYRG